jgi:hypothetical protein
MKFVVLAASVAAAGLFALPAAAQEAILYCRGEEALIRFDGHPLPAGDNSRWAIEKPAAGNRCTLASGARVVVRYRQTAGTPFGMGGANREAVFSLWVNDKKVVNREEFRPHTIATSHKITMNHALYTSGRLQVCSYAPGQMNFERTETVTCAARRWTSPSSRKIRSNPSMMTPLGA